MGWKRGKVVLIWQSCNIKSWPLSKYTTDGLRNSFYFPYFCYMNAEKKLIAKMISNRVHQLDPEADVYLFGSRVRGDEKADSDWDLLILTKYPVSLKDEQKFRHFLIPLELETGEAFSTFVYEKNDWNKNHHITPFYQNVSSEGIKI